MRLIVAIDWLASYPLAPSWLSAATAALHHSELAEGIDNANSAAVAALSQLGASGYDASQSMATINRMIDQQAYTLAVNDLFFLSGVLFVVLLAFIWAAQPAKNVAIDVAGAH